MLDFWNFCILFHSSFKVKNRGQIHHSSKQKPLSRKIEEKIKTDEKLAEKLSGTYSFFEYGAIKNRLIFRDSSSLWDDWNFLNILTRQQSLSNIVKFINSVRGRTSVIRDSLWFDFDSKLNRPMICKWVNHDSPTFDFWFVFILIRGWIVINDESKSNRIKINQNQKWKGSPTLIKNKKKILMHRANQKFLVISDSHRRIKMNRFGPSPDFSIRNLMKRSLTFKRSR